MPTEQARKNLHLLEAIRSGRILHYGYGGLVGPVSSMPDAPLSLAAASRMDLSSSFQRQLLAAAASRPSNRFGNINIDARGAQQGVAEQIKVALEGWTADFARAVGAGVGRSH